MKHNFLVLFAGCGALAAVGFAGSQAQTARPAVALTSVCAQAPVAVVISPDGTRSIATCVATPSVAAHATAVRAASPCVAVAVCDPSCDPNRVRATPSVVRVSTNGNGQVLVCGSGNGVVSVGSGPARSVRVATTVGSGSNPASSMGGGTCSADSVSCTSAPSTCAAGQGTLSATQGSCAAGQGSCSSAQGACAAGPLSGTCNSTSIGVGRSGQAAAGGLSCSEPLTLRGQSLSGALALAPTSSPVALQGSAAQPVDLGALVQGLQGSVGTLAVQGQGNPDSSDEPHVYTVGENGRLEMLDASDLPEIADVQDMDDADDAMGGDEAWPSDAWKVEVEQALEQARAQVDGADDATREAIENAQAEMERAQSGWASADAQRAYKDAMEKARGDWHAAMVDAERAQAEAGAQQRAGFQALAEAQAQRSKADKERMKAELRVLKDGQEKRAKADGEARGMFGKRSSDDSGLEARVEALEKIAKARGHEVSGTGSLESRVAELERSMRGQAGAAPRARVLEVPRGKAFGWQEGSPKFDVFRPATPKSAPRAATPPTPPTAPTPATPRSPAPPRIAAPRMHVGSLGTAPGMDADARRDLERAMNDLRREADRLREEMSKLRSEIDRLPRDSSR